MKTTEEYLAEFVTEIGEIAKEEKPLTFAESMKLQQQLADCVSRHARLIEAAVIASISSTKN